MEITEHDLQEGHTLTGLRPVTKEQLSEEHDEMMRDVLAEMGADAESALEDVCNYSPLQNLCEVSMQEVSCVKVESQLRLRGRVLNLGIFAISKEFWKADALALLTSYGRSSITPAKFHMLYWKSLSWSKDKVVTSGLQTKFFCIVLIKW